VSGARVGLLGGSGLYALEQLEDPRQERTVTPFGEPSDAIVTGRLAGVPVAFLARHGRGHKLSPTEINYRANICALKMLGCDAILSASAVGSLHEQIRPTDLVIPDQFIDRTRHREDTFFGGGIVGHVSLADPVCPALAGVLSESGLAAGANVHRGGTYVCMEGPQFSTRAESQLYRDWGGSVIGMTNLTEARLAREAEICYATLALVTDYDCWREATDAVSVEQVLNILAANAAMAQRVLLDAVGRISPDRSCGCRSALRYAVITAADAISSDARERLRPIVGKYLS
jgi:5'-methylthioadenosine phosphorylase